MVQKDKIAILSNVINFDLYQKTAPLFPSNIDKYVIDGRNGMHGWSSIVYWIKKFKNKKIKWLILCDEDVIFKDSSLVFDLIQKMENENYHVAGARDGGIISHRKYNPYLINTFFCILNVEEIYKIWDLSTIKKNNFIIQNEFNDELESLPFSYDKHSLFETYYPFFLFLRRKAFHFLFLDSKMLSDEISNELYFENKKILTHTWYARSYGINEKHTKRIDAILNETTNFVNQATSIQYTYFKDRHYTFKLKITKIIQKIKMKLKL